MVTTIFTAEHDTLREGLRRFVERELEPQLDAWDSAGAVPAEAVAALGSLGAFSLGEDLPAAVVLAEEIGRAASGGLAQAVLANLAAATLVGASPAGAGLADGKLRGAVVEGLTVGADGGLRGQAGPVPNATVADVFAIVAPDGHVYVAAAAALQVTALPAPMGCHAAGAGMVAGAGIAEPVADGFAGLAATRMVLEAAAAVAGADRTWERAVEYAGQRHAFGRPIGRFQVNRHALAELATWITATRALVHDTAYRFAHEGQDPVAAAVVAHRASRTANDVADRCLQVYGGYGYSMEFEVQRFWRDARHLLEGDSARLETIADQLERT